MQEQDERSVTSALEAKYPVFAGSTISRWVRQEGDRYATAKIMTFVPILVQRSVDATLRQLARRDGVTAEALSLDHAGSPA